MMRDERNFDTATMNNNNAQRALTGDELMKMKKKASIGLLISLLHFPAMLLADVIAEAVNPGVGLANAGNGIMIGFVVVLIAILGIGGALKQFLADVIRIGKNIIAGCMRAGILIGLPLAYSLGIGIPLTIIGVTMFFPSIYMLIHFVRIRAALKEAEAAAA